MSYSAAIQSCVFYFLACSPCRQMSYQHKKNKKYKKEKDDRARLVTQQPQLYRHPLPHHTNAYWKEEIAMGPRLERRAAPRVPGQRDIVSAGKGSVTSNFSGSTQLDRSYTDPSESTKMSGEDWNRRRYQREDEELWGHELLERVGEKIYSAGRKLEAKLGLESEKTVTNQDRQQFYQIPKVPPVNDYHPPIVTNRPAFKGAHKWMLQPPPPAKVMEGKVPVGRVLSNGSAATLDSRKGAYTRCVIEIPAENSGLSESELIDVVLGPVASRPRIVRARSQSFDSGSSSDSELERRRRPRRRLVIVRSVIDDRCVDADEGIAFAGSTDSLARLGFSVVSGHAAQRPNLQTITSHGSRETPSSTATAAIVSGGEKAAGGEPRPNTDMREGS